MNSRIRGLDLYRIIACSFVIINHCNSKVLIQLAPKSLAWFVAVGVIFFTKVCVPGFFMITGYNLLHRREDYKTYINRVIRIVAVIVIFTLVYHVWNCAWNGAAFSLTAYLGYVWHGGVTDAFWYLYTYLGILILMPALQAAAQAVTAACGLAEAGSGLAGGASEDGASTSGLERRKVFAAMGVLIIVLVSVIPSIMILVPGAALSPDLTIPVSLFCPVMYLFIGHICYINMEKLTRISGPLLICVYLAGFALNMALCMAEFAASDGISYVSYSDIHTVGMLIMSVSTFIIFLKMRVGDGAWRVVSVMAPATFGIYLFADMMCSCTHMIYWYLCQYMNRLAAVAVQDVAAYAAALALVLLLRLIPPVRKLI